MSHGPQRAQQRDQSPCWARSTRGCQAINREFRDILAVRHPMFRRLTGLPPYGPMATCVPEGWGQAAREGLVVEFRRADGPIWIGNFEPGIGGIDDILAHPNGADVLVVSSGQLWQVNPTTEVAIRIAGAV